MSHFQKENVVLLQHCVQLDHNFVTIFVKYHWVTLKVAFVSMAMAYVVATRL